MKNKSKTFLSFEESANKNWFMKPSEGKVERVLVEFADGTSYVYSTKAEIKAGDVAVISLRGKTGDEMGKILGPTTKGGGKSHLNPVQFTFATEPTAENLKKMASAICDFSKESVVFNKFSLPMYGVDSHAFLIDREIVFTLYAISIVANPDIVTPQALKKATDYLKRPKTLCPEFFGANTKDTYYVVGPPGAMCINLRGYYHNWEKDWKEVKSSSKLNTTNVRFKDDGFLRFIRGSEKAENIIRNDTTINEYYNDAVMRSALCIIVRGGFVNLLKAIINTGISIEKYIDMVCELAEEIGSLNCLDVLNNYKGQI